MAACFVAGAAGAWEDEDLEGATLGAGTVSTALPLPTNRCVETWELENMCNSQFTVGKWHGRPTGSAAA